MAVVTIISILMVIAIPSISHRLQEYRSQQVANEISALYRNARMRALARGSAVVVRWSVTAGKFTVYEAVQGSAAPTGCEPLPAATCPVTTAQEANLVVLRELAPESSSYDVVMTGPPPDSGTASTEGEFDICYSPLGAASSRTVAPGSFSPLTGVPQVTVSRSDSVGLTRRVLVLPNGTSRVTI